ncbi:DUF6308 family protein [Isoptericola sp. b490]|uniref:DUF6308 family protein n=1 Tax=Actinotalea lenta TaxID=3064654 RepID=UPI0027127171|nr:DUF6308 family protein [Isoptericola sp. b490]MDO8122558.1 DUF6308 family protein [Isoptericola sp. b490]
MTADLCGELRRVSTLAEMIAPMVEAPSVWSAKPVGWRDVADDVMGLARKRVLEALLPAGPRPVGERLARFYDRDGDYAGATFAALSPNPPNDLTAVDLHAVSMLSVSVGPRATRRLLDDGPSRNDVLEALEAVPVMDLHVAGPEVLEAMGHLYTTVKGYLSAPTTAHPNRWVTASKICARKRPALFPVRDRVVCGYLGLLDLGSWQADYQVFRSLLGDPEVQQAVDAAADAADASAGDRRLRIDTERLRILDAALWTYPSRRDDDEQGSEE